MLRVAGSLSLSFLTAVAPPSGAPEVQRPNVQRPEPATPAPEAQPAAPATPAPVAPSAGGPPVLPPSSTGAAPSPEPQPQPTSQPQPATPAAPAPVPASPTQPSAPAPDPNATTAPAVQWEDPAAAPVMSGTPAPDPGTVQWETESPAAAAGPAPVAPPPRPWARGIGMQVTGGLAFGVGLSFRIAASVNGYGTLDSVLYSVAYNPLFATGLGLWGGGRAALAHQHAWDDSFGKEGKKKRLVMPALGWGLFGAGMAVWLGTRFAVFAPSLGTSEAYGIWEAGYYLSLPLTFTGVHFGAYGSAYRSRLARFRFFGHLTLSPMRVRGPRDLTGRSSEAWGLSLSGRF